MVGPVIAYLNWNSAVPILITNLNNKIVFEFLGQNTENYLFDWHWYVYFIKAFLIKFRRVQPHPRH